MVSGTVVFDSTANSTEACATVKRAELTGRSPKELSNVTINSVSDSNDWDTRVGTAQLTGANTNTDYNASFTHFLQLDEPFDEANVSYTIYEGPNKSSGTAKATGTVTLSSNDKYSLSSDVNVLTATLKVENWGETNQVCQWVEYSPTLFAFVDGVYSASSSSGTRKTNEVCASVTSPSAKEVTISANSTANESYQLPAKDMSANGIFHFNHRLTNNNEGGINVDLPTTYSVYYKVTTKTRNQDWTIAESAGEYTQREGKYQIDTTVGYASPTNIIDQLEYTIQGNQSVTVCEYISLNYNVFQVTDDASKTIVGKDQREPYKTSEVCQTITRPGLMRTDGDPIIITGNTNYNLTGETDKLDYSGQDGNIFNYKIGKTNNVQVNFTHTLTRNNVEKSEIINNIYYLFEDSNEIAHNAIDSSFTLSQATSINNNETISLSNGINKDFGNNNTIPMSSIGAGETKSACRNVYFKHNRYKIQYDYYYDWDGNRLEVEGTPYVTQTIDDSTDGIDNSDLVCVSVLRPYNFHIETLTSNNTPEILYAGDSTDANYSIKVRKQTGDYWSKFALTDIPNARIKLLGIVVNEEFTRDSSLGSITNLASEVSSANPCDHYRAMIRGYESCDVLDEKNRANQYIIRPGNYSSTATVSYYLDDSDFTHNYKSEAYQIPTLAVGKKFCTALAISPVDSGTGESESVFNTNWIVSDISCSTIAKKPTIQVLGNSVFSEGKINTSKSSTDDITETRTRIGSAVKQNIYILIDNSGSMTTPIADFAAKGVDIAKKALEDGGKVALYSFTQEDTSETKMRCTFDGTTACSLSNIDAAADPAGIGITGGHGSPGYNTEGPLKALYEKVFPENPPESGANVSVIILTDSGIDNIYLDRVSELSRSSGPFNFFAITTHASAVMDGSTSYTDFINNTYTAAKVYEIDTEENIYEKIEGEIGYTRVIIHNYTHFGSWTDFALISKSEILGKKNQGMASGAALSGGKPNAPKICDHSPLTIRNDQCDSSSNVENLGQATNATRSTNATSFYDSLSSHFIKSGEENIPQEIDGVAIGKGRKYVSSDGKTIVYYSETDLTIKTDLTLNSLGLATSSYQHLSDIPQIVLLAGNNIIIQDNVKTIDAWVVAKSKVNTCNGIPRSAFETRLNSETCKEKLSINGPVIANEIELPRTYGADVSKADGDGSLKDAAEVIDYNPLTFLWGYNQATKDGQPKTVYLKKLAPRW